MKEDVDWAIYFENADRFADLVNGVAGLGEGNLIKAKDVKPLDSKTTSHNKNSKYRDSIRKIVLGVNFVVVDVESQETVDYSYPLRDMGYSYAEYEKQEREIKRKNKSLNKQLKSGEYLYRFTKENKLKPVVIFLIYSGIDEWDGPLSIYEMMDWTDIPKELKHYVQNYHVNLIDIRRMSDAEIDKFKTDICKVFKLIKYSEDRERLSELVYTDDYYNHMDEEAFLLCGNYINGLHFKDRLQTMNEQNRGKYNMCKALEEMIQQGRQEGIEQGRQEGIEQGRQEGIEQGRKVGIEVLIKNALLAGSSPEDIAGVMHLDLNEVIKIAEKKVGNE